MTDRLEAGSSGDQLAFALWRKSSYSESANGCVEAADLAGRVGVRDSRDPHGPVQLYTTRQWSHFVSAVRSGELGR
jgi:hypothetical protein